MKVKQLTLQNFTVFEDQTFEFSPGLNVIIGANSTGKTHALKALYVVLRACRVAFDEQGVADPPAVGPFLGHCRNLLIDIFKSADGTTKSLLRNRGGQHSATSRLVVGFDDGSAKPVEVEFSWGMSATEGSPRFQVPEAIFIPPDDAMSFYRGFTYAYERRELDFDRTYYDLCKALSGTPLRAPYNEWAERMLAPLRQGVLSNVVLRQDRFYLTPAGEEEIEAPLAAEGLRRIATLMQLISNGSLTSNSILLWDEPEANLNPKLVGVITELLMSLASAGIQVVLCTHDFLLSSRLSLEAEYQTASAKDAQVRFFALSRQHPGAPAAVEHGATLAELTDNPILDEFAVFYDREQKYFATKAPAKE